MRGYCIYFLWIVAFFVVACSSENKPETVVETNDSISIKSLTEKIRKNPLNAELFSQRADLFWKLNEPDSAVNDAAIASRLDSLNDRYVLQLADYLLRGFKKSDSAIALLQRFIERKPQSIRVLTRIGKYYSYLKDYKKAKEYIDKAFTLDPQFPDAHFVKGMILYETNQFKEAIKAFSEVIQYNPDESEAYMMIGLIYQEQNDSLCIQYYQTAARLKGKDPQPYYNMAYFYQENKQYAKAIDLYNYILRNIDKNYAEAFFNQGYIFMAYIKDFDRALKYYDSVLILQPNRVEAICNKAYCYEQLKDYTSARSLYIKAKAISPNYEIAINGLNRLDKLNK